MLAMQVYQKPLPQVRRRLRLRQHMRHCFQSSRFNDVICVFLLPHHPPDVCASKCWCLSYVFSALGLFSYCLPGLFGSSSSRPVWRFCGFARLCVCRRCSCAFHCDLELCLTYVFFFFELYVHDSLQASVENIVKEKMPKKGGRWWFSWRSRNSDSKSVMMHLLLY